MPDPLIVTARPAITIDGQAAPELSASLVELVIVASTAGPSRCEAVLVPSGGFDAAAMFDRQRLDFGATLRVDAGAPAATLFEGRVGTLGARFPDGAAPALTVVAENRLADLRATQGTRVFEETTDADVVRAIAGSHGLDVEVDVDGPTRRVVTQLNQTDLTFLLERAAAVDADVWVDKGRLHVQSRARHAAGTVDLSYGAGLRSFSVAADAGAQPTMVVAAGWDATIGAAVAAETSSDVMTPEIGADEGGASARAAALGERVDTLAGGTTTDAETRLAADIRFKAMARRFVTGRGDTDFDAGIRPGAVLNLAGLGLLFSGRYRVREVTHTFTSATGMRTTFTAERPGIGAT